MNYLKNTLLFLFGIQVFLSCQSQTEKWNNYKAYPAAADVNLWPEYSPEKTTFRIWSPTAIAVQINLYDKGDGGERMANHPLKQYENGIWEIEIPGNLNGKYYTFQVSTADARLDETPGIYAQAVGVNGKRAMVVNLASTNPEGWENDKGPALAKPNEAIIYELQIRDLTIAPNSGSNFPGKYLGVIEKGTKSTDGLATGIDHIRELGITHIHLLPTYDHRSIDETKLDSPQFNWGYDPLNYNVPEGSFSSDPYNGEVRIKEFKQMVKGLHDEGIGVILDVVYNHTGLTEDSYFNREVPGYYYRQREDGSFSDASACGNETASEREMMRKYMIESCKYWMTEYHLDGFRFDLMGIHDIETMNLIADELRAINPEVMIYGEGWTAGDSPLPKPHQALKANTKEMPYIAAFSDDLRDGLKGSVFIDDSKGFVSGEKGTTESIKFGVVGSIDHSQIDYEQVNYSDAAWANEPWQAVSYVSCHDNHTVYDKIAISRPDATEEERIKMALLTNSIVMTTQGIAFMHAGAEMLRTKNGEHNSYNLPDSINQLDWSRKAKYSEVFAHYQSLIKMRKEHPAFYMPSADLVRENLHFVTAEDDLIAFTINGEAVNDSWKEIMVVYNTDEVSVSVDLDGAWKVGFEAGIYNKSGIRKVQDKVSIMETDMLVLFR